MAYFRGMLCGCHCLRLGLIQSCFVGRPEAGPPSERSTSHCVPPGERIEHSAARNQRYLEAQSQISLGMISLYFVIWVC